MPRLIQIGKFEIAFRGFDFEDWQRQVWLDSNRAAFLSDDDQAEPRAQVGGAVGFSRREEPREIGTIEFDRGKVIRLEVIGVRARLRRTICC